MIQLDQKHPRGFIFFISQYFWIAIFLLFLLIGVIVTPYQKIKPIKSSTFSNSSNNIPPVLIMHLTDIHLNSYQHIRAHTFKRALSFAAKNNISKLIISGDLVDNKRRELSYGVQSKTDYPHYISVLNEFMQNKFNKYSNIQKNTNSVEFFSQDSVIDIPGNHDEYGVPSYTSNIHRILDFSIYFQYLSKSQTSDTKSERINLTTFWASRTDITDNVEIISLNPFRFPTPHAKLGFWNHPTTQILDDFETVLLNTKKAKSSDKGRVLFVQCHFPIRVMITNHKTSSSHLTINQMLDKYQVDLFLTGHLHPKRPSLLHTPDGILEVVGSDLKGHLGVGIISVDKGNQVSYHAERFDDIESEDMNGISNVVVLSPIPIDQISRTTVFNDKNLEIRVIVFTKLNNISISVTVYDQNHQKIESNQLVFDYFVNENQALYVSKVVLNKSGKYKIELSSDTFPLTTSNASLSSLTARTSTVNFDFYVGDEVTIQKEKIYCYPNLVDTCFAGLVIFIVFNVFVTFPLHFHSVGNHGLNTNNLVDGEKTTNNDCASGIARFNRKLEETHQWILGLSDERHFLILFLFGPLLIRRRLYNLPLFMQILLFILALWPLCLPLIFMTIEGKFAMIWMYGYACDGKLFDDVFGYIFAFIFEVFLSCSTIAFFSMVSAAVPWKLGWMWLDVIVFGVCMIFLFFLDFYFVYEASYYGGCFTSPEFFIFPLLFILLGIIFLCRKTRFVEESTAATNAGYPDLA